MINVYVPLKVTRLEDRPAFAVITATWLTAPALAQTMPPPAISVTGEANVSVAPDQALIDGGVTCGRQDRARGLGRQ